MALSPCQNGERLRITLATYKWRQSNPCVKMASVPVSKWPPSMCQNGTCPRVKMASVHVSKMARKNGGRVPVPGVGSRCKVVGPVRQVRPFNGEHVVVTSWMKEPVLPIFSRRNIKVKSAVFKLYRRQKTRYFFKHRRGVTPLNVCIWNAFIVSSFCLHSLHRAASQRAERLKVR